ncbi:protein kinase [Streptomonospora sp. S1-112]|uniref:Protein kinase n=1 Tax=Streptomonospora mangrovi TaxID=2883123 RepID=A0A9X3NIX2_9ACTN|nr:protein kinase [Streptomonospora mangrovi]MDA0563905.1 protein kinase [Streptomonospora mangrovi]
MAEPQRPGAPHRIGPYRVLHRLGRSAVGRTYLAAAPDGRRVAVTLLDALAAAEPGLRRGLVREIAALRRIGGARTVPVLAADTEADPPWVATPFVAGMPLDRAVYRHGPLPAATVAVLGAGAAEGLAQEHAAGLLRGRLVPADVLLAADGPLLVSPALVRAAAGDSSSSVAGLGLGALGFLPPETLAGAPAGTAADVFALACVLVYAATGRSPFAAETDAAAAYRVLHAAPDLADVPAALAEPLAACLAKDPAGRPTAEHLAEALRAAEAPAPGQGWLPEPIARIIAAGYPAVDTVANSGTTDAPPKSRPATVVPLPDSPFGPAVPAMPVTPVAPPAPRSTAPPAPPPPDREAPVRVARPMRRRLTARGALSAWDLSGATALDTRLAPAPRRHAPPPRLAARPAPRTGTRSPEYAEAADLADADPADTADFADEDDVVLPSGWGPSPATDPRAGGETAPPPWAEPVVPAPPPVPASSRTGARLLPALLAGSGLVIAVVLVGTVSSAQSSALLWVLGALVAAGVAVPATALGFHAFRRPHVAWRANRRRLGGSHEDDTPPNGSTDPESSE